MSDIDDILDSTLDDLEDLPEFKPYCPGAHKALATMELKEVNGSQCVELKFTYVEEVEVDASVSEEDRSKAGDEASTLFMMDNEFGRGNFKKCAKPFAEAFNLSTNREVVEAVKDVEVMIVTSIRKDKNDSERKYLNVKEIAVL